MSRIKGPGLRGTRMVASAPTGSERTGNPVGATFLFPSGHHPRHGYILGQNGRLLKP